MADFSSQSQRIRMDGVSPLPSRKLREARDLRCYSSLIHLVEVGCL